jgi:hypothetical protein
MVSIFFSRRAFEEFILIKALQTSKPSSFQDFSIDAAFEVMFEFFDSKITPQCMYRGRWWIGKITVFKKGRKIHFSFDFCSTSSLSTITFWSKLRWLGHIFRKPPTRYFGDSPDNDFEPCSSTPVRGTTTFRGRPSVNWRQVRCKIHRFSRKARREVMDLAQDRRSYHQSIERQCSR